MKVLVQWSKAQPDDWQALESPAWAAAPAKPVPGPLDVPDDSPGWVNELTVQAVAFCGYDHYAVEELGDGSGGIRVSVWNDDLAELLAGQENGQVWVFLPLAPDARFGGAYNTRQAKVEYGPGGDRPWAAFPMPAVALHRHGIWHTDAGFAAHRAAQSPYSWREWTEGLPAEEIVGGRLRPQRSHGRYAPAAGTKTYFQRDTDRASGVHAADHEDALDPTAGTGQTEAASIAAASTEFGFLFTTDTTDPNDPDWPNGTYRFQADVNASGANITWRLGQPTGGTLTGHFGRVNSGLTADQETVVQAEGDQSGTGLKLVTASWDPAAGAAGDRFECLVAVRNAAAHSAQSLTLLYDADAFADGPWPIVSTRLVQDAMLLQDVFTAKSPVTLSEGFSDNFNDNTRDTTKWNEDSVILNELQPAHTVAESNQQLRITLAQGNLGYKGYSSVGWYNLYGSHVRVEVVQIATPPPVNFFTKNVFILGPAQNTYAAIYVNGDSLTFERTTPLVNSQIAYDVVAHHHWRIRHEPSDNTLRYETSPDAVTWTQRESFAVTFDIGTVLIELLGGLTVVESTPGTVVFDNFNTTASQVYTRPVQDAMLLADLFTGTKITPAEGQVFERLVQDGILMADIPQREEHVHLREALPLADRARQEAARLQSALDAMLLGDQARQEAERQARVPDGLLLSDAVRRQLDLHLRDAMPLSEVTRQEATRLRAALDTLLLQDQAGQQAERRRSILDALLVADVFTATKVAEGVQVIERLVQDVLLLAEAATATAERRREILDAMTLSDVLAPTAERRREILDALLIPDGAAAATDRRREILDRLLLSDAAALVAERRRAVLDALLLSDVFTAEKIEAGAAQVISRLVQDTLLLADAYQRDRHMVLRERAELLDDMTQQAQRLRAILDLVATTDAAAQAAIRLRLAQDALPLADAVQKLQEVHLRDQLPLADAVAVALVQAVIQLLTGIVVRMVDPLARTVGRAPDLLGRTVGWRDA